MKKRTWNTKSRIISELRRLSRWMPGKQECILAARLKKPSKPFLHWCAACNKSFPLKQIAVDHISPIVPTTGWDSWDALINRLFCEGGGLQVLCKPCHKEKTILENQQRRSHNRV